MRLGNKQVIPGQASMIIPGPRLFRRDNSGTGIERDIIEGSGIGLALARELMRLHGGDLSVNSEIDAGACFHLHWPAQARTGTLARKPAAEPDDGFETAVAELPKDPDTESPEGWRTRTPTSNVRLTLGRFVIWSG